MGASLRIFLSKGLVIGPLSPQALFHTWKIPYLAREQPTGLSAYLFYGWLVLAVGDGLLCLY